MALPFNSKPEKALGATSAGISSESTWKRPTAIRGISGDELQGDRLEFVIEESKPEDAEEEFVYRLPAGEKKYE